MRFVSRLFLLALPFSMGSVSEGASRIPDKASERSLLYWRYLCQGEPQEESIANGHRNFHCLSQGWAVRTPANSGVVQEIVDDAP